ncbi:MAG: T9SS type A sorting domain-containing protein, partial [Saprospiraceae bacterium]
GVSSYKITDHVGEVVAEGGGFASVDHQLIGIDGASNPILNNGAISRIDSLPIAFCSHLTYSPNLELLNLGVTSITQAEIELLENGHLLQLIQWTGNIQPGAIDNISVPPTFFSTGKNILFRIKSINGAADTFEYQNEREANLERHLSEDHTITLEMQLDYWAYEVYWQLTNSAGEVVYSGGNTKVGPDGGGSVETQPDDPGAYDHEELVVVNMDLPDTSNDCYDFLLVDGNGDGIIFGGYVRFSETHNGKEVVYEDYSGIEFVTTTIPLEVNPIKTFTETLADVDDIFLYPNPVQSEIQVQFETKRSLPVTLSVINMLGENVLQLPEKTYVPGISNISLDMRVLPCGIYYVQLVSGNQRMTLKLAVIR